MNPFTYIYHGPVGITDQSDPNPFTQLSLKAEFSHVSSSTIISVNGYFTGESTPEGQSIWKIHFHPTLVGLWGISLWFFEVDAEGNFTVLDGQESEIDVEEITPRIIPVGRYLMKGDDVFLKCATDSPENFLAYNGFVNTPDKHHFNPHLSDWVDGDPDWNDGQGKRIIGAINYLSSVGLNGISFLTYNVAGDGDDVWPFLTKNGHDRMDTQKLDQWFTVFHHIHSKGMMIQFKLVERENDQEMFGDESKWQLYLKELIARFGHLNIEWNLGEEWSLPYSKIFTVTEYIRSLDPYGNPIVIHNWPSELNLFLDNYEFLDGASLQEWDLVGHQTIKAIRNSPWHKMIHYDEQGSASTGIPADPLTYEQSEQVRHAVIWGAFLATGSGVSFYHGYQQPHDDLDLQDFRSRFSSHMALVAAKNILSTVDLLQMAEMGAVVGGGGTSRMCLGGGGQFVIYFRKEQSRMINVIEKADYEWTEYDPANGEVLDMGLINNKKEWVLASLESDSVWVIKKVVVLDIGDPYELKFDRKNCIVTINGDNILLERSSDGQSWEQMGLIFPNIVRFLANAKYYRINGTIHQFKCDQRPEPFEPVGQSRKSRMILILLSMIIAVVLILLIRYFSI